MANEIAVDIILADARDSVPGRVAFDDPALGFDDPALGFDDPALGFDDPALGFDDPALGLQKLAGQTLPARFEVRQAEGIVRIALKGVPKNMLIRLDSGARGLADLNTSSAGAVTVNKAVAGRHTIVIKG